MADSPLRVVNIGVGSFIPALLGAEVPVIDVAFVVPGLGDSRVLYCLERLRPHYGDIWAANSKALGVLVKSQPEAIRVLPAREVLPGLEERMLLHAGPPLTWERASGPVRGALAGAAIYEGWAHNADEAADLLERGEVSLSPCHDHSAVGPMAGVISPSMPVWVVQDRTTGRRAYANLNEGLGRVLRFGACDPEVIDRLSWMERVLGPMLDHALTRRNGLDVKAILSRALHMGDEGHNRNVAATSLLVRELAPCLVDVCAGRAREVMTFLAGNDHFFLNLSMAAAKLAADAASGIQGSTVVTAMARNGTDFGLRISGLPGRWFVAPAPRVQGLYFPSFGPEDANPDLGDSAITETVGLGAFAMAAAPAIVKFVGGTPADAWAFTRAMREITVGENPFFTIPVLDFAPVPCGIDALLVVRTGVTPVINTGIAHREPGRGQVGAGVVRAPFEPFVAALEALTEDLVKRQGGNDYASKS